MPKVAILTDSIACLPKVPMEQYRIVIVPLDSYSKVRLTAIW